MWRVAGRRCFHSLWTWYSASLDSKPLLTQASTTGVVCGLGDCIAQMLEKRGTKDYDFIRTIRMTSIGFLFTGPVLRGWFMSLDRVFGPTRTIRDAAKKVFVDQFVFAPVLSAVLLTLFSFSRGMNSSQVKEKVKADYFNMMRVFYTIWPAAQLVNFYFVPLKYRVSYTNVVSLVWNIFLGYLANRPAACSGEKTGTKET